MRNKKESSIIRIDQEAMKGVLRKIKGSDISIVKFVSEAIKKEVNELDEQNNAIYLKEINDHYNERLDHYARLGINSFEEFASRMASNTDNIIRLEKKIEDYEQTTREMIATVDQEQLKIFTHEEMKQMLKEINEQQDKEYTKSKRSRKQS